MRKISVVIGTYNRKNFLKKTIKTLREELSTYKISGEVFVVDGGSNDGTLQWLIKQKDIITIAQHNRGMWNGRAIERKSWGYFMNLGFKAATSDYVLMLSDDCLVVPGAIDNSLQLIEGNKDKKIGAIAYYWRNWPVDKKYYVGLTFGKKMFVNHGLFSKEALERVGYIEDEKINFYHADGDLALKIWQAGYECIDSKKSFIEHYADANIKVRNSNLERQQNDWNNYRSRWSSLCSVYEGGWKEIDFVDSTNTANMFWINYVLDYPERLIVKILGKIKRKWRLL